MHVCRKFISRKTQPTTSLIKMSHLRLHKIYTSLGISSSEIKKIRPEQCVPFPHGKKNLISFLRAKKKKSVSCPAWKTCKFLRHFQVIRGRIQTQGSRLRKHINNGSNGRTDTKLVNSGNAHEQCHAARPAKKL